MNQELKDYVTMSMDVRTAAHLMHLSSRDYAEHRILDTFYKVLTELTDRFAEAAMGMVGQPQSFIPYRSETFPTSPIPLIKSFAARAMKMREGKNAPWASGVLDETVELALSTIYQLENLK